MVNTKDCPIDKNRARVENADMPKFLLRRANANANDRNQTGLVNFELLTEARKPIPNGIVTITGPLSAEVLGSAPDAGDYVLTIEKAPPQPKPQE